MRRRAERRVDSLALRLPPIILYVKFGVDDSVDLMPLKNLYRSHILQIARYVGVPQSVIKRTPNPEGGHLGGIATEAYATCCTGCSRRLSERTACLLSAT
jgi:hypothetical protein